MIKNVVEKNKNIDVNADKMDKLKELFPNCFNANGDFDISVFEEELKENTSIIKEGYGLNFLGKNYAKYVASLDTETILVPDEENNNKDENINSENIYISGDNIDALKHLVKSYSGEIKCIYIDPPYNTGSDGFVYNDKFNLGIDKLVEVLDINEEEAKRIYNMTNAKSNSHSAWLTFMYPRLYLAKQLLSDDGAIFISIDDNEQGNLKLLCDSIFGEENLIGPFIWQRAFSPVNLNKYYSQNHDYIICYAKNTESLNWNGLKRTDEANSRYDNPDNDPRGVWTSGDFSVGPRIEEKVYPIKLPSGRTVLPPSGRCWRVTREKYNEMVSDNRVWFGEDGNGVPRQKRFLCDVKQSITPMTIWEYSEVGHSQSAKKDLNNLFDGLAIFDYPKSVELIKRIIGLVSNDNDLILDFFSGSATTAHAVMKLNAEDNSNRKYIMVQLPELCDTKSEAYKNGYKTIDEIGQERIRRAAKKIKEETNADIDYGFKHYTIKDVNTNTLDKLEKFEPNYVISDGSILDEFGINAVLSTWMNQDGYGLTDKYEKLELKDYTAYKCQNTIYLLNWNISDLFIKALIEKYEKEENFDCNRIVMFGYSFTLNDIQTLKDNLQQVKNIKGINVEVITRY